MKYFFYLTLLFFFITGSNSMLFAGNIKQYKIRVFNGRKIAEGILYNVTDSGVVISTLQGNDKTEHIDTIPYSKISKIRVWRKGKGARAYWIGVGFGVTAGIVGGQLENDPSDKAAKVLYVFLGFLEGQWMGGIGAAIAHLSDKRLIVAYDYSRFKLISEQLYNLSYIKALYDRSN